MALALDEAKKAAEAGNVAVGAVIVRDGHVLSRGHNVVRSTFDISAHAEAVAVRVGGDGLQAAQGAKVRVGYINNVQSAALVHLKSLSQEEDLDIELVPFTRYPDVQKALAVDSIDVGVIAPNGLPAAVAQGDRNVVAIMDLVYGGNSMVARNGVQINAFSDLRGKRIGLAEGGISWMMFMMLLEQHKLPYTDIKALNFTAATDAVNALKHGDMDVVDLWEPFVSQVNARFLARAEGKNEGEVLK